jgi:hypothetical protein
MAKISQIVKAIDVGAVSIILFEMADRDMVSLIYRSVCLSQLEDLLNIDFFKCFYWTLQCFSSDLSSFLLPDEQMSSLDGEPNRDRMDELEKRISHQGKNYFCNASCLFPVSEGTASLAFLFSMIIQTSYRGVFF